MTKRKVRRPKAFPGCSVYPAEKVWQIDVEVGVIDVKEAKRLIKWLTQAVAWLEQEEGK